MKDRKIIYIGGAGRSGSTILDITLGNMDDCFSLGELIFFVENGIIGDEYCSCGSKVKDCLLWSKIFDKWNSKRILNNEIFVKTQYDLLRNKRFLINIFSKPKFYGEYLHDLQVLYESIFDTSNKNILIDSSKNGNYIKILKKIGFELEIIHLKRFFFDRYKSTKKTLKVNPAKGIEREINPMSFRYSLLTWIFDNFTVFFHSLGLKRTVVYYHDFINDVNKEFSRIINLKENNINKLKKRGPFQAKHLVAGSRVRMENEIYIKGNDKKNN